MSIRQIVLDAFGNPPSLRLESFELTEPVADEVIVRMQYAPINPADLNVMEGRYPKLPPVGGVPGNEGVGIVDAVGPDSHLAVGDVVIAPGTLGSWASHRLLRTPQLIRLDANIDLQQAAMLTVNPATAWRVLSDFVELEAGDWVVVNAGNSGVGRWLIHLAAKRGIRVGAVVRRAELIEPLSALGAAIVVTEEDSPAGLREAMGGGKAKLALNMVGGDSSTGLMRCLGYAGTHVTCGAMGLAPVTAGNGALIFKDLRVRGYWHTSVIEKQWNEGIGPDAPAIRAMYEQLSCELTAGTAVPIAETYPLEKIQDALTAAGKPARGGKVLLDLR